MEMWCNVINVEIPETRIRREVTFDQWVFTGKEQKHRVRLMAWILPKKTDMIISSAQHMYGLTASPAAKPALPQACIAHLKKATQIEWPFAL